MSLTKFLKDMSANEDRATSWVKDNVQPDLPETPIRGITVGNEVLGGGDQELEEALLSVQSRTFTKLLTSLV
ncbi:hypothetical protein IFM89_026674 [Coptis chinensis]|uniref:Glucan endo-1,3-beta-D-glucosidase n=1 Tax=Coptis chinensis TaxID=261450 RepID=A0A835M6Q5_9MAGN|nr:hypothetical protein IFM89_026674 [Coptis chinensis]